MKKKRENLGIKVAAVLFVIIFILLYTIIYIVPHVSDIFTRTYTAEFGTLRTTMDKQCIFVRDEQVYKAEVSGEVTRNVDAGELLRVGSLVVTVGGNRQYCGNRGIVSYYSDGYEERLTSKTMEELTEDFLTEYENAGSGGKSGSSGKSGSGAGKTGTAAPAVTEMKTGTVEAGEPVFKMIDNKAWYLVFWADKDEAQKFSEGAAVSVDFDKDTEVEMSVSSVTEQGDSFRVILSCNRTYKSFDRYRVRNCTVVTSSSSGIIIETDSIVEEGGAKGVYVVDKLGDASFVPIKIIASQGDRTAVEKNYFYDSEGNYVDTVQNYDEILKQKNKEPEEEPDKEQNEG